jgi:hypothetical protein
MFRQLQNLVYQHNNARPHVARAIRDFLQANNFGFTLAGVFTGLQPD